MRLESHENRYTGAGQPASLNNSRLLTFNSGEESANPGRTTRDSAPISSIRTSDGRAFGASESMSDKGGLIGHAQLSRGILLGRRVRRPGPGLNAKLRWHF